VASARVPPNTFRVPTRPFRKPNGFVVRIDPYDYAWTAQVPRHVGYDVERNLSIERARRFDRIRSIRHSKPFNENLANINRNDVVRAKKD